MSKSEKRAAAAAAEQKVKAQMENGDEISEGDMATIVIGIADSLDRIALALEKLANIGPLPQFPHTLGGAAPVAPQETV